MLFKLFTELFFNYFFWLLFTFSLTRKKKPIFFFCSTQNVFVLFHLFISVKKYNQQRTREMSKTVKRQRRRQLQRRVKKQRGELELSQIDCERNTKTETHNWRFFSLCKHTRTLLFLCFFSRFWPCLSIHLFSVCVEGRRQRLQSAV